MHVTDSMRIISLCRLTVRQSRIGTKGIFITFSAVKIWCLPINLPWSLACLKPMIPFVAGPSSEPPLPMLAPLPPLPPPLGLFLSEMPRPTTGGRVGFKGGRGAWGGTSTANCYFAFSKSTFCRNLGPSNLIRDWTCIVVSYQNESFSSKWELPTCSLPPS